MKKLLYGLIFVGCLMMSGCSTKETVQTTELAEYVQELTGVQVTDICKEETGEVTFTSSADIAHICLTLQDGGLSIVQQRIEDVGKSAIYDEIMVPYCEGHELAKKLKEENIICWYCFYMDGKGRVKTRPAEIYLSTDENGQAYLYLLG